MGITRRLLALVHFSLQHYTFCLSRAELHEQHCPHVARFKVIVGFQLFPGEQLFLCICPWSGNEVSANVSVLFPWPVNHVWPESVVLAWCIWVILEWQVHCFQFLSVLLFSLLIQWLEIAAFCSKCHRLARFLPTRGQYSHFSCNLHASAKKLNGHAGLIYMLLCKSSDA